MACVIPLYSEYSYLYFKRYSLKLQANKLSNLNDINSLVTIPDNAGNYT